MVTGKHYKPSKFTRFVLYPFAGLVFLAVLTVILIMANGYRFKYNSGKVTLVKTGMLIVTSRPFDGQIVLNDKNTKYRAGFYLLPTRISGLAPGFYNVEVKKTGYRNWENRLEITPNMVTWANYILLFADKLNVNKINVPAGHEVARSQNGRHILYANATQVGFELKSMDTNSLAVKDFWPQSGITDTWLVQPKILSSQYSTNNDRVLLTIQNGDKTQYVVADGTGSQPKLVRLSEVFAKQFDMGWWSLTNNSELYLRESGNVYLVNINDTVLQAPIATNVISLYISEARLILYVTKSPASVYTLNKMNLDGGQKEAIVESIVPSRSYQLGYSSQNNVVTVLNNDTGLLDSHYIGSGAKKYSLKMSDGVLGFGWSKNGQKLNYWGKDFVKRYDWEKNKEVTASLPGTILSLEWYFDENHYIVTSDKGVYVIDYDGANKVDMSDTVTTLSVLDQGNNNIIFTTKAADGSTTSYKYISEF